MSQPVAIASDSSVDVPAAEATRRGISLASIQIALSRNYFRDTALPRVEFYHQLPQEPRLPTIVAPCLLILSLRIVRQPGKGRISSA